MSENEQLTDTDDHSNWPTQEEIDDYLAIQEAESEAEADIAKRCEAANIPCDRTGSRICMQLPDTSNSSRWVVANDFEQKMSLQRTKFEKVLFISGYDAFCIPEDGVIQAAIALADPSDTPNVGFYERLLGQTIDRRPYRSLRSLGKLLTLSLLGDTPQAKIEVQIGLPSEDLEILLCSSNDYLSSHNYDLQGIAPGITISMAETFAPGQAKELLKRLADAVFFQIDVRRSIPLMLRRESARPIEPKKIRSGKELVFPRRQYDEKPMSLYWYGRSARELPLLQFLAFYQVIEFYFPVYSNWEAAESLRHILSQPTFSADKDESLLTLLRAIKVRGNPSEKAQLRDTLEHCLADDVLRRFLGSNSQRLQRLTTQSSVSGRMLPSPAVPHDQLFQALTERIYDIRCKIVHTKNDGETGSMGFFLPFSEEAEALIDDIELIRFVSQNVLINGGKTFHVEI